MTSLHIAAAVLQIVSSAFWFVLGVIWVRRGKQEKG